MYFDDIIEHLRAELMDYEVPDELDPDIMIPPKYSDHDLGVLLGRAMKKLYTVLRIPKEYRLDIIVSGDPYFVDPNYDINDDFAELMILSVLCMIQKHDINSQYGMQNVSTTLGPASLKTGDATYKGMPAHIWKDTSPCAKLEEIIKNILVFNSKKIQTIYAVVPRGSSIGRLGGREQGVGVSQSNEML